MGLMTRARALAAPPSQMDKSFLLLLFTKEALVLFLKKGTKKLGSCCAVCCFPLVTRLDSRAKQGEPQMNADENGCTVRLRRRTEDGSGSVYARVSAFICGSISSWTASALGQLCREQQASR